MQDFLSCVDDKFLGENLEQLRKFVRRLFVDGAINEQDWIVFKAYESDFRNWQPSQETNITLR